jgi:ABC-2 type transport system permease protein
LRTTTTAAAINLWRHLLERHRVFLTVTGIILAGFQALICAIVSSTDIEGALTEFSRSLPAIFQAVAGEELALGMTSRGLLAFAWNHPVVHALLAAVMLGLASRAIAGEIEGGTMELVLSQPISRPMYLGTQIVFALAVLITLAGIMLVGVHIGLSVFELQRVLQWRAFLPVAVNLISLEMAIYGVTLLLSSSSREAGRVVTITLLFVLLSYLLQAIARIWPAIHFLLRYTIFEYYSPQRIIMSSAAPWRNVMILSGVGLVAGGLGWWKFMRRDIP